MTEQNKWVQVKALLKKLPYLTEQDIEGMPKTKNALWIKLQKLTKNSISYHFDEDVQMSSNKIFDQLNALLGTKKGTSLKQKGIKKLNQFPQIILTIISEAVQQAVKLQQQDPDIQQLQEKALANVFGRLIPRWTYSQLIQVFVKKLKKYQAIPWPTEDQKRQIYVFGRFEQQIVDNADLDVDLVDRLIINRIGQNPNDTLNSSTISEVRSFETLDSRDDFETKEIQQALNNMNLGKETQSEVKPNLKVEEKKKKQEKGLFVKKEYRFLDELEEKPQLKSPKIEVKIEHKEQQPKPQQQGLFGNINNRMNLHELPIFSTDRGNIQRPQQHAQQQPQQPRSQQTQQQRPQQQPPQEQERTRLNSQINQSLNDTSNDLSYTQINQSMFENEEDKKRFQDYSEQLIERFASQSRFTRGIYENRREAEVRQIEQDQVQPLEVFLNGLTGRHLDKFSQSFGPIGVELYGSYPNKAGFRKTSDININLTIDGIQPQNMHSTLFGLRHYIDNNRKRGTLNSLNLRSVSYSEQHQEVILSHENNRQKRRQSNVVNYIYLTINKSEHVLSSHFMREVIYNGQDKATDIANLTNLLHLLFRGNCILDHKDRYHTWWTQTPHDKAKKELSQSRFVTIPIYVMHMMILYYLSQDGVISKIKYSNQIKSFDYQLINHKITLFEMFVGFLTFYSSKGSYIRDHVGSVIDVVEKRPRQKEQKICQLVQKNAVKIQSKDYLFAIVHPRADALIDYKPEKCLHFDIPKGSNREKLFFTKIDDMLKVVENLKPGQKFEANQLFAWNNVQFD